MTQHIHTPLLFSHPLSHLTKKSIYLKLESLQPSGSFKDRGIGLLCDHFAEQNGKGFISSSGGNAGMAVAFAGRRLDLPATVVIPETCSQMMIDKIHALGADVKVHGKNWNEADELAHRLVEQQHLNYIHPFNHPMIWQGHESIVDEIEQDLGQPDCIILAVGGGGLLAGVIQGLEKRDWLKGTAILTAETQGADAFAQSMNQNKRIVLKEITSIATTLGAKQVSEVAFDSAHKGHIVPHVVSDKEAVQSCLRFAYDHRLLVEPACGAPLSIIYEHAKDLAPYQKVCVIVCGGNGVSLSLLSDWKKKFNLTD